MAEKNILFELIDDMFTNSDVTQKYTDETFKQNQFMLNRIIAIKYPREVNMLNIIGMNPKYSAYTLNGMLYNGKGKESWVFTGGKKKVKDKVESKKKFSSKLIKEYCKWYGVDICDVEFGLKVLPQQYETYLSDFEELMKKMNEK